MTDFGRQGKFRRACDRHDRHSMEDEWQQNRKTWPQSNN